MSTAWVRPRAKTRADRAGDPLDGLVNMFDLGIVLAVAFLIAALEAHNLTKVLTQKPTTPSSKPQHTITVSKTKVPVRKGKSVGTVYQLPNGQLVYVKNK